MLDDLLDLLRVLFYLLAFAFFMMALPFVICHVADTWDAPAYPHSGFTPDCPTWEATENTPCEGVPSRRIVEKPEASEPHGETRSPMPPTEEHLATRRAPRGEF